jgi:hypothetical protein
MQDSLFWRIVSIMAIATGLYIGHGLHESGKLSLPRGVLASPARAGNVGAMREDTEYFVTASEDGQTVYVWEFNGVHEPRCHAKSLTKK